MVVCVVSASWAGAPFSLHTWPYTLTCAHLALAHQALAHSGAAGPAHRLVLQAHELKLCWKAAACLLEPRAAAWHSGTAHLVPAVGWSLQSSLAEATCAIALGWWWAVLEGWGQPLLQHKWYKLLKNTLLRNGPFK